MKEAEVTTGEILEAVNRSFSHMQERFDGLEHRFDGLEGRFDGLEGRFNGLEKRFNHFEFDVSLRFNTLESELRSFKRETDDNFADVKEKLDDLYDTDRNFDQRIAHLEERANA